jgi:hypothetical protein
MPEEEYFGAVAEVNSTYLKSITNSKKLFILFNLVYFLDKASGNYSHYKEYTTAEFSRSKSSYAINESFIPFI